MLIDRLLSGLADLGIRAAITRDDTGAEILELDHEGKPHRFPVEERARAPYPSELGSLEATHDRLAVSGTPLLAAPYVSETLGKALIGLGWSWADDRGNYDLAASGLRLRNRTTDKPERSSWRGFPKGGAGLLIVRTLIGWPEASGDRLNQGRLAAMAGVTQARVSQILAGLAGEGLVSTRDRNLRWDRATLLDAFLDRYPGPGGREHHWYTLDPLLEAGRRLSAMPGRSVVLSADVAADLIAPSKRPTRLIVYCKPGAYGSLPFGTDVAADSPESANVIVREPKDGSVFGPLDLATAARIGDEQVPLADPTQVLWDLIQLGGRDRQAAAEALRGWLLSSTR